MQDNEIDQLRNFAHQMNKHSSKKNINDSSGFFLFQKIKRYRPQISSFVYGLKKKIVVVYNKTCYLFSLCYSKIKDVDLFIHIWIWKQAFSQSTKQKKSSDFRLFRLVEMRKQYGDTSVIIRKRIPIESMQNTQCSMSAMSFYFQKSSRCQSRFAPRSSIWDFPMNDKRRLMNRFLDWISRK